MPWLEDGAKQLAPRKLRAANGRHCQLLRAFDSQPSRVLRVLSRHRVEGCAWSDFVGRSRVTRELQIILADIAFLGAQRIPLSSMTCILTPAC